MIINFLLVTLGKTKNGRYGETKFGSMLSYFPPVGGMNIAKGTQQQGSVTSSQQCYRKRIWL